MSPGSPNWDDLDESGALAQMTKQPQIYFTWLCINTYTTKKILVDTFALYSKLKIKIYRNHTRFMPSWNR